MICISVLPENFAQTQIVLQEFDTLSEELSQLREQLQRNGFFFKNLEPSDINELFRIFAEQGFSATRIRENSLRVTYPNNDIQAVIDFLRNNLFENTNNPLIQRVLENGFCIGDLDNEVAEQIKTELEARGATVTIQTTSSPPTVTPTTDEFIVRGRVLRADGTPVEGVTVRAYDKDLRSEQILGHPVTTDADGSYEITYSSDEFSEGEIDTADLIVRTEVSVGSTNELVESQILFNAGREETIDLIAPDSPESTEYERFLDAILPLIRKEGVSFFDLREDEEFQDITFISGETGIEPELIRLMIEAEKLNLSTPTQEPRYFYGLLRQDLPASIPELLALPKETLRSTLRKSHDENIIQISDSEEGIDEQITTFLKHLVDQEVTKILETDQSDDGNVSIGHLINIALPLQSLSPQLNGEELSESQAVYPERVRERIARAYVENLDNPQGFEAFLQEPSLDQSNQKIKTVLKLAEITQNKLKLVRELSDQFQTSPLQEIAQFSHEEWINRASTVVDTAEVETYVQTVEAQIEDNFPTRFFRYRVAEQLELTYQNKLVVFLDQINELESTGQQKTNFDIRTTFLDTYLEEIPELEEFVSDDLRGHIKRLQRLYKLTPRYTQVRALEAANFHSSQQITRLGHNVFLREQGDALGGEQAAAAIYENAQQVSAMALNLFMRYREEVKGILPAAISQPDSPTEDTALLAQRSATPAARPTSRAIANLETLFGEMNLCACEHCQSVYSPAAYLVDLLEFLKDRKTEDNRTFQEVLFERRPDIQNIQLSCANTNTVVPYIDLVNEILEEEVAKSRGIVIEPPTTPTTLVGDATQLDMGILPSQALALNSIQPSDVVEVLQEGKWWNIHGATHTLTVINDDDNGPVVKAISRQTTGTTAERKANPQYLNTSAYDVLTTAAYPWSLPFDLWQEETRTYLGQLNVQRHKLMATLSKLKTPINWNDYSQVQLLTDIATVQLGFTAADRHLLKGENYDGTPLSPWLAWGFPTEQNWVENLKTVRLFLDRSGLEYEELQDLLKTRYIRNKQIIKIQPQTTAKPDTCNLNELELDNLNAKALEHIQYFVRLQKKLGWTIQEVDLALSQLGIQLGPDTAQTASSQLPRSILTGADGTFLGNPGGSLGGDTSIPGGPGSGTITVSPPEHTYFIHLATIQTLKEKLNLSVEQILTFWTSINTYGEHSLYHQLFQNPAVTTPVNPAFKLKQTPANPTLQQVPLPPVLDITTAGPKSTEKLSGQKPTILAALGISDEDFDYLIKSEFSKNTSGPNQNSEPLTVANLSYLYRITLLAKSLNISVRDIVTFRTMSRDADPFAMEWVKNNPAVLFFTANFYTANTLTFIERLETIQSLGFSVAELDYLLRHNYRPSQGIHLETNTISTALEEIQEELKKVERIPDIDGDAAAQKAEKDKQFRNAQILAISQRLSNLLNLNNQITYRLLSQWVRSSQDDSKPIADDFLITEANPQPEQADEPQQADDQAPTSTTAAPQSIQIEAYTRLHKISLIINKLQVQETLLPWLFEKDREWLDLNTIPADKPDASVPTATLEKWLHLLTLVQLQDMLPKGAELLDSIFKQEQTDQEFLANLSEQTGWPLSDLRMLVSDKGFNLTVPDDYGSAYNLHRLHKAFTLLHRLGVSAKDCLSWSKLDIGPAAAINALRAVKAKYSDEKWLSVAQTLRDPLREKQRDALVAFLLGNTQPNLSYLKDTSDLYGHYLVDPEMSACRETSRIKQAISSVQLFIQRCQLGLEQGITVDVEADDKWKQWEWMKQYRVWEANRKIFLYPENWLEPELRDDKSPFFQELENELLQSEPSNESAKLVTLNYLKKLAEISKLEIVGQYFQNESGIKVLHVVARTYTTPHTYYYRTFSETNGWAPWEKISIDIDGDYILPTVINGKFHIFWVTLSEQQLEYVDIENPNKKTITEISYKTPIPNNNNFRGFLKDFGIKDDFRDVLRSHQRISKEHFNELGMPSKGWGIELSWSYYHNSTWSSVQKSKKSLSSPYQLVAENEKNERLRDAIRLNSKERLAPFDKFTFYSSNKTDELTIGYLRKYLYPTVLISEPSHELKKAILELYLNYIPFMTVRIFEFPSIIKELKSGNIKSEAAQYFSSALDKINNELEFKNCLGRVEHISERKSFVVKSNSSGFFIDIDENVDISNSKIENKSLYKNGFFIVQSPFLYPFSNLLLRKTASEEIDNLYRKSVQQEIDFKELKHANYSWEIFFHAPFLIAKRLTSNQKFEEAQRWLSYIFRPILSEEDNNLSAAWITKPLQQKIDDNYGESSIQLLLKQLETDELNQEVAANLRNQIKIWKENPFSPHHIARLRTTAYQKAIVMAYLDNLIAWGDQLFRRFSIESINEATQLYLLAAGILGARPKIISPTLKPSVQSYASLLKSAEVLTPRGELDQFGNTAVLAEFENLTLSVEEQPRERIETYTATVPSFNGSRFQVPAITWTSLPYFCIPANNKLIKYWDTVEDRLFKVRNCQDLEGNLRQPALFEVPIDPGLLVRAKAAGLSLQDVLDVRFNLPTYRFNIITNKVSELCSEVRNLGSALLTSLEKQDSEKLALLRSTHEVEILSLVQQIREQQINDAASTVISLKKQKVIISVRQAHYQKLLSQKVIPSEEAQLGFLSAAAITHGLQSVAEIVASIFGLINLDGWRKSTSIASSLAATANTLSTVSSIYSINASHARREQDWKLQIALAVKELAQIDQQIIAAEIRLEIAKQELINHKTQIKNAEEVKTFMESKFTNHELYNWMISQISSVYFQSYQLAFDVAKQAEQAYRFELGKQDSETDFIQYGYWDNLKKGLLAGERLHHDLKQMEVAYLNENKRLFELTKHISLATLNPVALLAFKQIGKCEVSLPEVLFDLDYPGHYMRRIKSVSLTIPCVTGPYTTVNCTLTLEKSSVRIDSSSSDAQSYFRKDENNNPDSRFRDNWTSITKSIATSSGQNDSGLFELNFRDERYLPFEGAGVDSRWTLELPDDFRQFDYDTISDVIFHIRYTAKDGGDKLKQAAAESLKTTVNQMVTDRDGNPQKLLRLFSAKHELASQWHRFQNPAKEGAPHTMIVKMDKSRFPFLFQSRTITIEKVDIFFQTKGGKAPQQLDSIQLAPWIDIASNASDEVKTLDKNDPSFPNHPLSYVEGKSTDQSINDQELEIILTGDSVKELEDLIVVCHYKVDVQSHR